MLHHTAAVVSLLMTGHIGGGASGAGEEVHATNLFQFLLSVDAVSNIFILKWLGGRGGARTADIGLITTTAIIWTALGCQQLPGAAGVHTTKIFLSFGPNIWVNSAIGCRPPGTAAWLPIITLLLAAHPHIFHEYSAHLLSLLAAGTPDK